MYFKSIYKFCLIGFVFFGASFIGVGASSEKNLQAVVVHPAQFGRTESLRTIASAQVSEPIVAAILREVPRGDTPPITKRSLMMNDQLDAVLPAAQPLGQMPDPVISFAGLNNLDWVSPSDCNGDVGPHHYVEMVNGYFCIYDKNTGEALIEPTRMSALFAAAGFPAPASTVDNGDPIVLYDSMADRWMISQFIVTVRPCHEVIAISQTPDPTGAWFLYDFVMPNDLMNDYPHFGVWPDAYYMTDNQFGLNSADGAGVFAFDRVRMLAGDPDASYQYFNLGDVSLDYCSLLPADLDGPEPPPGTPNYLMMIDKGRVSADPMAYVWKCSVDWDDPTLSTLGVGGEPDWPLPVADFNNEFTGGGYVIPQKGTATKLDVISDRLMYRLQYRNFGDRETLTVCHTVNVGENRAGVRYYTLERALQEGAPFAIADQATYAPDDGNSRWMGSAALDGQGNLAIGYSVSGTNLYPSLRYAGRFHDDPLGGLWQAEASIVEGTGSQTGINRWGDYAMLAVDPTDDATFWFCGQYTLGRWDWETRIGAFRMDESSFGTVTGCVTSAIDGAPLEGVLVQWQNYPGRVESSSDGSFKLSALEGAQRLQVSFAHYLDSEDIQVDLIAGVTSRVDIALMPEALWMTPYTDGASTCLQGGECFPGSFSYTISNAVLSVMEWQVSEHADWLDVTPSSGTLSPLTATTVVCTLNQQASFLPIGATNTVLQINAEVEGTASSKERTIALAVTGELPTQQTWNFDEGLPAGWAIQGDGWSFDDPGSRKNRTGGEGTFAMVDSDFMGEIAVTSLLVTAACDLSGMDGATLAFKTDFLYLSGDHASVEYSLNGTNGPWTVAWSAPDSSLFGPRTQYVVMPGEVDDTANTAFRFYYSGDYSYWWEVDDVRLLAAPVCSEIAVEPLAEWQSVQYAGDPLPNLHFYRIVAPADEGLIGTIGGPDWIDLSVRDFVLQAGQSTVVTASVNAVSSTWGVGGYDGSILFATDSASLRRSVHLTVEEPLKLESATAYTASGLQGGPFSPSQKEYILHNQSSVPVEWSGESPADWLAFGPGRGTIAGGESTTVTVSAVSALLMDVGLSSAEMVFSNRSIAGAVMSSAQIEVIEITGEIGVSDSVSPIDDLSLPFGVVSDLMPHVERVVVANTGENDRSLEVSNLFFGYYNESFDTEALGWRAVRGNWAVSNGAYRVLSDSTANKESRLQNASWADVRAAVNVAVSPDGEADYGIGVRTTPDFVASQRGGGYVLLVYRQADNSYFSVIRQDGGAMSFLQEWTLSSAIRATRNTLALDVQGDAVRGYINGTLVADLTDPEPLDAGSVALMAVGEVDAVFTVSFDDVTVGPSQPRGIGLGRKQIYYNARAYAGDIHGPYIGAVTEPKALADRVSFVAEDAEVASSSPSVQPPFSLSGVPELPIVLAPGESFAVDVTYAAANLDPNLNVLTIVSNDNDQPRVEVAVSGRQVGGSISGQVTDAGSGATLANALVVVDFGETSVTLESGVDGIYKGALPLGTGVVSVTCAEYAPATAQTVVLSTNGQSVVRDIVLFGTNRQFTVTGADGTAIASGAAVQPENGSDFGAALTGRAHSFTLANSGNAELKIYSIAPAGNSTNDFRVLNAPVYCAPGSSTVFSVVFAPQSPGTKTMEIHLLSNSTPNEYVLNVAGVGLDRDWACSAVDVTPSQFDARWNTTVDTTHYYLDVSPVADFATCVEGYFNRNVGEGSSCIVTGLTDGVTYLYRVRAANEYGSSYDSTVITVPVGNNTPYVKQQITNGVASAGSSDVLALSDLFNGTDKSYQLVGNSNSNLVTATIDAAAGTLTLEYADGQSGTATLTVREWDEPGYQGFYVDSDITVYVTDSQPAWSVGPVALNLANGLFEQTVRVTNTATVAAQSVTLSVSEITDGATLYNATGTDADGNSEIQWSGALAAGGSMDFTLQYYTAETGMTPTGTVSVSFSLEQPEIDLDDATPITLTGTVQSGSNFVIGFNAVIGKTYTIQYADTASGPWQTAQSMITALTKQVQWIDSGPPVTTTPGNSRVYRVFQAD